MLYLFTISLCLGIHSLFLPDFPAIFGKQYENSCLNMKEWDQEIYTLAEKYSSDPQIIRAVLFPELMRYGMIRDIIETSGLELVYVSTGEADFSIGPFQMKPSFAEKLENYAAKKPHKYSGFIDLLRYQSTDPQGIRRERIDRLQSGSFQILYAILFYQIVNERFPEVLKKESTEFQVRFFATAYNHDFLVPRREIENYMNRAFYPFGSLNNKKKYIYSDISWYFFLHRASC